MKNYFRGLPLHGILIYLTVCLHLPAIAQVNFNKDSLDKKMEEWLPGITQNTPGYVLGVISNGELVYTHQKGSADLENAAPIGRQTIFNIGSVSKQFTAFLILQLAEEGKLTMQDLASRYLTSYPVLAARPVRISHLLYHTSGLREMFELLEIADGQNKYGYSTANVKYILQRQQGLNFQPGERFQYINTNYFLLAEIIEKVTGMPFAEYCRKKIFEPLGMKTAFVMDNFRKTVPLKAKAYLKRGEVFENAMPIDEFYGANGIHCSIDDLLKWAAHFNKMRAGNEALYAKFITKGKLDAGQDLDYGHGLMFGQYKGARIIDHNGARLGYRAEILHLPEQGVSIVALANFRNFPIVDIPVKIADYILKLQPMPAGTANQASFKPAVVSGAANPGRVTGVYWDPVGDLVRKVYVKDGKLTYHRAAGNETVLAPGTNNTFYFTIGDSVTNTRLYFPGGKNTQMVFISDQNDSGFFRRVDTTNLLALTGYAGTYYCDEIDASFTLEPKQGALALNMKGWPEMALQQKFRNYFNHPSLGSFYFEPGRNGAAMTVMYDSPRTRHLRFRRI